MTQEEKDKIQKYAKVLGIAINELFVEDEELINELDNPDNFTMFIHVMSTVVPTFVYNKLAKDDKSWLEFNHMANHLVFQYNEGFTDDNG